MIADLAQRLLELMEHMPKSAPQAVVSDLSRGEIFILNYLRSRGGPARPGEISAAMQTSTARTAAALGNMEKKGWVHREPDRADRRHTLVHLTAAGSGYIESIQHQALENIRLVLEELGEADAKEYLRITQRMVEIINRRHGDMAPLPKEGPHR